MDVRKGRPLVFMVGGDLAGQEELRWMLAERYDVLAIDSVAEVGLRASEQPPDLLLKCATTADEETCLTLGELLAHPATRNTPVIVISRTSDEDGLVRCLEMGAADFLAQPFSPRVLLARLERTLRTGRERQALQAMAQTDALTGLANFRALSIRLEEELKRANRYHYPIATVMIDLDNLKAVNDHFGHEMGNRAIVALAHHLRRNLRAVDFAARYGGDEFVVLLAHQTAAEAAVFADRIRAGLKDVRVCSPGGGHSFVLTVSMGIAEHRPGTGQRMPAQLLHAADAALYEAKKRGRNQAVILELGGEGAERTERHDH